MTDAMQTTNMFREFDSSIVAVNTQEELQRALQIAFRLSSSGLLAGYEDSYDNATKLGKKTQNMTEYVSVPTSEHVAEMVGKQGCKIKALREKTNTYIKTPLRGEEPVFVVTGRKEDVATARGIIQSAAEHFTQIRASRNRHAFLASQALNMGTGDACCPGTMTLQVRVPYGFVGLVVGRKGARIKRIQQQTHTYIVTPSKEKEPLFEITGLPENVEIAKEEIDAHITARTAPQPTSIADDFKNNGTEVASRPVEETAASKSVLRPNAPSFYPFAACQQPNRVLMITDRTQWFTNCFSAGTMNLSAWTPAIDIENSHSSGGTTGSASESPSESNFTQSQLKVEGAESKQSSILPRAASRRFRSTKL